MSTSTEDTREGIVVIASIAFVLCMVLVVVTGILSWLRKRVSIDWWRDRCGCFGGDSGRSMPSLNTPYGIKSADLGASARQVERNFDNIQTRNTPGVENPSFENYEPRGQVHGLTTANAIPPVQIPEINITRAPPDYHTLVRTQFRMSSGSNFEQIHEIRDSLKLRPRRNTRESRRHKVVSKPSITSDYVSDVESEDHHPVTRIPTGGRYSNRRMGEKKRHRRKHYAKPGTRSNHAKGHKSAATSLTNLNNIDLRNPVPRRHSVASMPQNVQPKSESDPPIPPARVKRMKRSASDAHMRRPNRNCPTSNNLPKVRGCPKSSSFRHSSSFRLGQTAHELTPEPRLQKACSLNPLPTKSSGLVRSETILELPIFIKPERPSSAQVVVPETEMKRQSRGPRASKTSRPKPPRSRKHAKQHDKPTSRRERWQYGYGSLPADWSKLKSSMLEQIGMTRESFVESIEKLDFEKLCRPVPTISDDQHQTSARKPVVEGDMPGHEREILKDTYELEEFGIVTTDL